uniref:I/LWEQ domain-containing protein n=1 Tax=Ciona savignyi TaxID=51511 RepID=H2ZQQ3_CIOSA
GSFHSGSVAMPGVIGNSSARPDSYSMGAMQPPTQVTTHSNLSYGGQPLTAAQQAFMGNIEHGFNACRAAHEGFNNKAHLPPLGSDAASRQWKMNAVAENRHHIQSNLAAIDAATATVITKTSGDPEGRSYTTVGSAITTISSNLNDMTRSMQLMASLLDDGSDGDGLMRAARDLTAAIQDLLRAAKPNSEEPRQNLLGAAGKIGASHDILKYIGDGGDDEFQASRDILMNLAKQVASATAALVLQAKTVASQSQDQITQNDVITSATKCALSTSQLVACTKVVGPTIYNPSCKEQLIDAAREVSHSVDGCLESTRVATNDPNLLQALGDAASNVGKALNDLINHIRSGADMTNGKYDDQCEVILNATDKLCNSMGNAAVMAKQAKLLGQATSDLVNLLKLEADEAQDDDWRKWLLSTVKLVAEATAKMVEAAKGTASNPHDSQQQQNLKLAAENLRAATNAATQNALRKKMIRRLEEAASHAAVAATQTIAAANAAEPYNTNKTSQNQLLTHSKSLQSEHIPKLLQSIHGAYDDLKNPTVQQNLITASNEFVPPATKMVGYSKAVVPTVSEKSTALQLANCTKKLALAVAELKTASVKAGEVCGASGIDAALETVTALDRQLSVYCNDAKNNQLQPLPGQTMQHCAQELGATSKAVGASMAQLLTRSSSVRNCSPQGNEDYTGMAARYTANALRTLVGAARGVAANLPDLDSQLHLLETCRDVMDKSVNLMQEAKLAVEDPENPENRQRLAQVAKAVSHALNNCINCLPGQRDVDEALKNIAESSKRLLSNQFPVNNANFQTAQAQLNRTAEELNIAANDLVGASRGTPSELAASSTNYNDRFTELLDAGMNVAGQSRDKDDQGQVIGNLKSISMASSKLLLAAKALSADPGAPNAKNQLSAAARAVTESINNLITHCTETAPGQKECDNALRQLKTVKEMLENPNEPVNDFSYFDCLESVMDNSKMLGESMSGITQHARASELESFGEAADNTHEAIDEAAESMKEAIEDLLKSVQEAPEALMSGMVDTICSATAILHSNVQAGEDDTFADYQTSIMRHCRAIVVTSSDMSMAMNTRPDELTTLAKKVTGENYKIKLHFSPKIKNKCLNNEATNVSNHIKRSIQDLGEACKELVTASGMVQSNPQGLYTKKDLNRMLARTSIEKVSYVMSSLQEGGRGTQACINAHTKVQGIIGDLDTTLMFVTSGALNPESDNESFAEHRENILATAKALVEDTKQLVAGAAGGQEKLAGAAQSASQTISKLADVVKSGASSLGADDPDTQVILINAVRDVASALADLINSTKDASGKSTSDQSMLHLKASAKAMVTNVTSLLKTVKSVEDEAAKGPRAIEQTINSIKQELKMLQSVAGEERRATPEELIQITKPITNATAKAVAAGKFCRQEDMIVCANMGRKAVFDMIHICRASAASTDDQVQQKETLKFGAGVAEAYVSLLSNVLLTSQQPGNNDLKKNLNPLSKNVATAVSNLVRSGESMKGTDWVDPNDPNVIAEQELLAAALSIEAAAKKLAQLRPRKKPKQADESLNFEEQILEAAKSIATATTALVKAASAAQKELVLQGKVGSIAAMRHDDGQWSQGLISAAQMVARATGNLCEAANQAVQGEASEEKLVTSAKQVASSTAQLLVACKVKADPNSENMKRLQVGDASHGGHPRQRERIAGNAVKHASEDLVKAASESANSDDEVEVVINSRLVGGIAQEMMAQEEILRKERELQSARQKLAQIRRMRYK